MDCRLVSAAGLFTAVVLGQASAADLPTKASVSNAVTETPFFIVTDNSLGYRYEFTATNPGAGYTPKNVFTFTHFDVWKYGTNFINVDALKATSAATPKADGGGGFREIYGFFRSSFGLNEIFNTRAFAVGPLSDVSLMVGADFNTDNSALHSAKKSIEAGVQFTLPTFYKGFVNLTPIIYKEWQHDGYTSASHLNPSGDVDFDVTWGFEWSYFQPLGFRPPSIPLSYKFFGTIPGPKGSGEPAVARQADRTTEIFMQSNLIFDVGQVLGQRPNRYALWVGYRWWKNKFGIDPIASRHCCTLESTWLTGVTVAF
jgi:hypothetical protein